MPGPPGQTWALIPSVSWIMILASVVEPDRHMITDSFDSAGKYNVSYQLQIPCGLFRTQAVDKLGPGKWVDPGSVGQSANPPGSWSGPGLGPGEDGEELVHKTPASQAFTVWSRARQQGLVS